MEATAEPVAQTPTIPAKPYKFTTATAREMSRRAAEARKANALAEKARVLAMEAENAIAKPVVDVLKAISASESAPSGVPSTTYVLQRLARVRAQLEKIDALIDAEIDPQKLDRLVCAQNRLSEQWRIFSGIPLPGSRRPGREKPARGGGPAGGSLMADE